MPFGLHAIELPIFLAGWLLGSLVTLGFGLLTVLKPAPRKHRPARLHALPPARRLH